MLLPVAQTAKELHLKAAMVPVAEQVAVVQAVVRELVAMVPIEVTAPQPRQLEQLELAPERWPERWSQPLGPEQMMQELVQVEILTLEAPMHCRRIQ